MIPIVIVVVLALGGGTSFAAENAVPGDALYPVKTELNENVRGALSIGIQAQADWQAELAERRLAEVEKLSASGDLKADLADDLGGQFNQHAIAALKGATDLKAKGDTEAAKEVEDRVQATITAHHAITTGISVNFTGIINSVNSRISLNTDDVNGDGKVESKIESRSTEDGRVEIKSEATSAESGARVKAQTNTKIKADTSSGILDGAADVKANVY